MVEFHQLWPVHCSSKVKLLIQILSHIFSLGSDLEFESPAVALAWWDLAWLMGAVGGQRSEHSPAGASHRPLGGLAEAGRKGQPRGRWQSAFF